MIRANMTLYYGLGIILNDRLTLSTSANVKQTMDVYAGNYPISGGRMDILAEEYLSYVHCGFLPVISGRVDILSAQEGVNGGISEV
jgi:hypothetical protein